LSLLNESGTGGEPANSPRPIQLFATFNREKICNQVLDFCNSASIATPATAGWICTTQPPTTPLHSNESEERSDALHKDISFARRAKPITRSAIKQIPNCLTSAHLQRRAMLVDWQRFR
jgi:hypothetical protein